MARKKQKPLFPKIGNISASAGQQGGHQGPVAAPPAAPPAATDTIDGIKNGLRSWVGKLINETLHPTQLSVIDESGTPNVRNVRTIRFSNGAVTANDEHDVSISGGGAGGELVSLLTGGAFASRPASANPGGLYVATDTEAMYMYFDTTVSGPGELSVIAHGPIADRPAVPDHVGSVYAATDEQRPYIYV